MTTVVIDAGLKAQYGDEIYSIIGDEGTLENPVGLALAGYDQYTTCRESLVTHNRPATKPEPG